MIISFGSSETQKIGNGQKVKKLPREIQEIGRRKFRMLNNSFSLIDLKVPPSNRLEKLSGDLKGFTVFELMINGE
jgi:toxin HigB-1